MRKGAVILPEKLSVTEKVSLLQRRIYFKAKHESEFRFYSLYDKISLEYVLLEAYRRVKEADGSSGIDNVSFADIEEIGIGNYLGNIQKELQNHTYKPLPVLRVLIPKDDGGKEFRKLGIPAIRDRIVQMAVKIAIEPIFEAEFLDFSYGFRPKRSASDAITEIKSNLYHGYAYVLDADISAYFDSIPHDNLMKLLENKITDGSILNVLKLWLKSPVLEKDGLKSSRRGTPQGGVISPLLSNIYLHVLDKIVNNPKGFYRYYDIKMVRYADDYVLMSKRPLNQVMKRLSETMAKMGLRLNTQKSKVLNSYKESFCFLGFEVRCLPTKIKGTARDYFFNIRPSPKSKKKLYQNIREYLRYRGHWNVHKMVAGLNKILLGWLNYFSISRVTYIWDTVNALKTHLDYKLIKWFREKSQRHSKLFSQRTYDKLVKNYHLLNIRKYAYLKQHAKV
jgi:RNA-directed DNA polymerase